MWGKIIKRAHYWFAIIKRSVWAIVAAFFALAGAFSFTRDEFLGPYWQARLKMPAWLPSLPWYEWVIATLVVVIIAILEGSYREYRDILSTTENSKATDDEKPSFRISTGETGRYLSGRANGLYHICRTAYLKIENIEARKALSGCKLQIVSISSEQGGPWVLDESITLAAGDHKYIPLVQYGESGSVSGQADSYMEIMPSGPGRPKPTRGSKHALTIRATAIDATPLDYVCAVWVDSEGKLRISEQQEQAAITLSPKIEILFEKRAPYEVTEVTHGHVKSTVRIGLKNIGATVSNCKVYIDKIAPEAPIPGGTPILLDGANFTLRHDDPETLVDIACQWDHHADTFRFNSPPSWMAAEYIDSKLTRTILIKIETADYRRSATFRISSDESKVLHLENLGYGN